MVNTPPGVRVIKWLKVKVTEINKTNLPDKSMFVQAIFITFESALFQVRILASTHLSGTPSEGTSSACLCKDSDTFSSSYASSMTSGSTSSSNISTYYASDQIQLVCAGTMEHGFELIII